MLRLIKTILTVTMSLPCMAGCSDSNFSSTNAKRNGDDKSSADTDDIDKRNKSSKIDNNTDVENNSSHDEKETDNDTGTGGKDIESDDACQSAIFKELVTQFGEDLNAGGNDELRPASTPNSSAAEKKFQAQLSGAKTESFESYPVGASPTVLSFGGIQANLKSQSEVRKQQSGTYNGAYPTTGDNFLMLFGGTSTFKIVFQAPQVAFGFSATDVGDGNGKLLIQLEQSDGKLIDVNVPNTTPAPTGSRLYLGIVDLKNPFKAVHFKNTNATLDGFGFDDMTIGQRTNIVGWKDCE